MNQRKHAVVTGARGGIGAECVRMLLANDWHVFALDVRVDELPELGTAAASNVTWVACDVSNADSVELAFAAIGKQSATINALICCSGLFRVGPLAIMENEDFDSIMAVNVRGPFLCAKAAVPMLESGSSPGYPSRLIFLSSVAATKPKLNVGAYAATKAALNAMAGALAGELIGRGIHVNSIAPGGVATPFTQQVLNDPKTASLYRSGGTSPTPLGRKASPSDVVAIMKFFLSNDSNNMVGSVVTTDGGSSAVRM
jgi:NAD(P)-dependent dehydrogenase (short-subunit alcohol dehydrogenase family)